MRDSEGFMVLQKKDPITKESTTQDMWAMKRGLVEAEKIITEQENVIEVLKETANIAEAILWHVIRPMLRPTVTEEGGDGELALDLLADQKPRLYDPNNPDDVIDVFRDLRRIDGVTIAYKPGYGIRITPHRKG